MKINTVTVEGATGRQSTISREGREIVIAGLSHPTFRFPDVADEDTVYDYANTLQLELDGYEGTAGDVQDYIRLIQLFTA